LPSPRTRRPSPRIRPNRSPPSAHSEELKVAERAKRDPEVRFNALAHLIDEYALTRAYERLRKGAAVGVDGVTKDQYGEALGQNI
jgi:hypothetical protein